MKMKMKKFIVFMLSLMFLMLGIVGVVFVLQILMIMMKVFVNILVVDFRVNLDYLFLEYFVLVVIVMVKVYDGVKDVDVVYKVFD